MKSFFSEFRSCYRSGTSKRRPPPSPPNQEARPKHARRLTTSKSESSAGHQWQPALVAISEDGVDVAAANNSSKGRRRSKTVAKSRSISDVQDSRYLIWLIIINQISLLVFCSLLIYWFFQENQRAGDHTFGFLGNAIHVLIDPELYIWPRSVYC